MYARIATASVEPGKMDDLLRIYRESQLAALRQQKGFQRVLVLIDRDNDKAVAVSLFETDSDARGAETSSTMRDQVASFEGVISESPTFEYYEVAIQGPLDQEPIDQDWTEI